MATRSADAPALSIVVPARNEEFELGATLESVRAAADALGQPWELIVVDDASTDRTVEIAQRHGARVVPVELHNIGAVRNAGARAAQGERLVFLDADTRLPPETLRAAWDAMESGAVGGGGWVQFPDVGPFTDVIAWVFCFIWQRIGRWAAGCFIFAVKADFDAVGGFDETYFAAEERYLTEALRERGRFVLLREHVVSSARKLRLYSIGHLVWIAARTLLSGKHRLQQREGLEILYDAPRESGG
ncbi:MAG: glycosyltransferase [Planctomycetaceae bacterium]|nr:glycosyltransferase [Planctomycetaceae bacterium]